MNETEIEEQTINALIKWWHNHRGEHGRDIEIDGIVYTPPDIYKSLIEGTEIGKLLLLAMQVVCDENNVTPEEVINGSD